MLGVVFADRNANGTRDTGEPGLPRVAVSDQDQVVLTGADGSFRLTRAPRSVIVFVSVPDGYRAVGKFWRRLDSTASAPLSFGLAPVPTPAEFTFIHASDTHISPASVARTRRLRELVDSLRPAFVLITGDLIRDALRVPEAEASGYYQLLERELAGFPMPVHTVPGNHEIFGIERHLSLVSREHPLYGRGMYRHYRGPDYHSFTYGGVHFVGLNTIGVEDLWYYGQVDSLQLAWLERDLAAVPADVPVVTYNHIPFFTAAESISGFVEDPPAPSTLRVGGRTIYRHSVSNAAAVLARLEGRDYPLALGGHIHKAERISYPGIATAFEQGAAVVGPTPGAGLAFPSGITVYRVRQGRIVGSEFVPLGLEPRT
ncbi:MAG: metallophosphoesterase [Gemmatimonadales bacterium]